MKIYLLFAILCISGTMSSQSVGINTTTPNPAFKLDVNGNITTKGIRTFGNTNFLSIYDQVDTNHYFRWNSNGDYARFSYNVTSPAYSQNLLVLGSNGRVGIGTANPTTFFDVSNSFGGTAARFNGGNNMAILLSENGTNRGYIGSFLGNAEDVDFSTISTNTTGSVHLGTNGVARLSVLSNGDLLMKNNTNPFNLRLQSNSSDYKSIKFENQTGFEQHSIESYNGQMNFRRNENLLASIVWDANDRLGIGQIVPLSKLHVTGGSEVDLTQHGAIMMGEVASANMVMDENEIQARSNSLGADLFVQHNGGNLILCGNEQGAVGIGVATGSSLPAGSLLAVDGKITCEEVLVKLSQNWPDYVFADDYKLKPLSEIKSFIKINKHLPGIPKAIDVETNGLELGYVQKQMMEKIEELTLYMIKLEEQVKALELKLKSVK